MSRAREPIHKPFRFPGQTLFVRVLVVDDDPAVLDSLERALRIEGYTVDAVGAGFPALDSQRADPADAIVLDLRLPDLDGLEVCRRLRADGDDYLVKPFALDELLARLRALLRRTEADPTDVIEYAHLRIDPQTREIMCRDRRIELTRTEFALLELLARNARVVLPRSVIFERVWGYDFGPDSNSLEVFVGYLRRKTEADGEPRLIQTVRGVGYVLRER